MTILQSKNKTQLDKYRDQEPIRDRQESEQTEKEDRMREFREAETMGY